MRIANKYWALLLVVVMVLAITGCNKKIIDSNDFEDVMDDFDFEVYTEEDDDLLGKNEDEKVTAYDADYDYVAYFILFDEKGDAIDAYEDTLDDIKDAKKDGDYDGTIKESGSGNYDKLVLNGEFDEATGEFPEGNIYAVIYRVGNTGFIVLATDNDKKDIEKVNEIIKELGY